MQTRILILTILCLLIFGVVFLFGGPAMAQDEVQPDETVLFEENFENGNFERFDVGSGVTLTEDPGGQQGRCAQITSSNTHETLRIKTRIPVTPGQQVVLCWKTRTISGEHHAYARIDFYDENGVRLKTAQPHTGSVGSGVWRREIWRISKYPLSRPAETRSISVQFHHGPGDNAATLFDDIRVLVLQPDALKEYIANERASELADALHLAAVNRHLLAAKEVANYQRLLGTGVRQIGALASTSKNNRWKKVVARHAGKIASQLKEIANWDPADKKFIDDLDRPRLFARSIADAAKALKTNLAHPAAILTYRTKPFLTKVLPNDPRIERELTNELIIQACPGEYQSASLVVWTPEQMPSVSITATDLHGPGGLIIPGENVDIKYVKYWYQQGSPLAVLVPELLLNDDTLVKVDYENRRNFLKLSYSDKPAGYTPIYDPTPLGTGYQLKREEFPVRDGDSLVPVDLAAGENKHIWITVKTPSNAKPGHYQGQIILSTPGRKLGTVSTRIQVLPFALASPRTHYDLNQEFTGSLYYWGRLDPEGEGRIGFQLKTEEQFRAELSLMYEHGIVAPCMILGPKIAYENEPLFRRHLAIMQEIGMSGRPLYLDAFFGAPTEPAELAELKEKIRKVVPIAKEYGFTDVYFYGIDEAKGDRLKSQRPAWEAVHQAGGKVMVSGFPGHFEAVGDLLNLLVFGGDPAGASPERWHKLGHKLFNYAHPQTTDPDPQKYRRNYGLYLWKQDFDGTCTYCFHDTIHPWNDFAFARSACNIAYLTVNGAIGTLALEGLREAIDDVRYATTLRLEIERTLKKGKPKGRVIASDAQKWLEGLDFKETDLNEVRKTMIRYILELRDARQS